jgi:hypothetical protein
MAWSFDFWIGCLVAELREGDMFGAFFSMAAMTLVVCAVLAVPVWIVAVWRRASSVALWFGGTAAVLSLLFGLLTVEMESWVGACETSGGIGCADVYWAGAWGFLFILFGYFLASVGFAVVVALKGTRAFKGARILERTRIPDIDAAKDRLRFLMKKA